MALLYNLARVTTATTGTGTITLGAAVSGYLTFALAGVSNGDVVDYGIKDGVNSEVGTGTYTTAGTTLTRTVTKSTNSNAAINLSGSAEVYVTARAETINDGSSLTTGTVPVARINGGTANQFVQGDGTFQLQGRKLLNTLTASASATLSDTTNFTSTFSEYELVFENLLPATNAVTLQLQVNTGGGVQSTVYVATSFNGDAAYGTVQFTNCIPCSENGNTINTAGPGVSGRITAYKWNAGGTIATQWRGDFVHLISSTRMGFCSGVGYWNSTTALTGVTISFSSGNITSGTVKIYGIG